MKTKARKKGHIKGFYTHHTEFLFNFQVDGRNLIFKVN